MSFIFVRVLFLAQVSNIERIMFWAFLLAIAVSFSLYFYYILADYKIIENGIFLLGIYKDKKLTVNI